MAGDSARLSLEQKPLRSSVWTVQLKWHVNDVATHSQPGKLGLPVLEYCQARSVAGREEVLSSTSLLMDYKSLPAFALHWGK